MILALAQKCKSVTGNDFVFVVNIKLWTDLQNVLAEFINNHKDQGAQIWSKQSNGYIKVGATYDAYEFSGNTIIFKVDRALSYEYPNKGFGVLIDLTGDKASGRPSIEAYTLDGHQLIENDMPGVGIRNGQAVSTVAGIKWSMCGSI